MTFFVPSLLCFLWRERFYYSAIGAHFKKLKAWHTIENQEEILQNIRAVLKKI